MMCASRLVSLLLGANVAAQILISRMVGNQHAACLA